MFLFRERNLRFRGFSRNGKHGVNLVAYIRSETGLGQAARGMAEALESAGVPFNILNFEAGNRGRHGDTTWAHKEVTNSDYDVTILVINPDNIFNARARLPKTIFDKRYVIGSWVWELPALPAEWRPAFSLVNEVWVPSRFVEQAVVAQATVPVTLIPAVVAVKNCQPLPRSYFGLPENSFLFLTVCDTGSFFERKNPLAALAAFKKAFSAQDKSAGLILKISGPEHRQPDWKSIHDEIQGYENIWLIDRILTPQETSSLLRMSDCLVSLHRSEGFGLVPAELMSLGKPVILTRWSGNTDYMTDDNSIGIDYQLIELERDYGPYEAGQVWADPDVSQAADKMRRLKTDPDLCLRMGSGGRQTIEATFSAQVVGSMIRDRLSCIREQHS